MLRGVHVDSGSLYPTVWPLPMLSVPAVFCDSRAGVFRFLMLRVGTQIPSLGPLKAPTLFSGVWTSLCYGNSPHTIAFEMHVPVNSDKARFGRPHTKAVHLN